MIRFNDGTKWSRWMREEHFINAYWNKISLFKFQIKENNRLDWREFVKVKQIPRDKDGNVIPDNFIPNGRMCIVCKKECTGSKRKYCSDGCRFRKKL